MILHPDRCKDPRAKDAWHAVEQAHKTLCDPDKRKVYLRIMRELNFKERNRIKKGLRMVSCLFQKALFKININKLA